MGKKTVSGPGTRAPAKIARLLTVFSQNLREEEGKKKGSTEPRNYFHASRGDYVLKVPTHRGIEEPRQWILAAIDAGKDVVTANKAVLAVHGEENFRRALDKGRRIYYEASVAAAIIRSGDQPKNSI